MPGGWAREVTLFIKTCLGPTLATRTQDIQPAVVRRYGTKSVPNQQPKMKNPPGVDYSVANKGKLTQVFLFCAAETSKQRSAYFLAQVKGNPSPPSLLTPACTPTFVLTRRKLEGQAPPPLLHQRRPALHRSRPAVPRVHDGSRTGPAPPQGKHQLVCQHLVVGEARPHGPGSLQIVLMVLFIATAEQGGRCASKRGCIGWGQKANKRTGRVRADINGGADG